MTLNLIAEAWKKNALPDDIDQLFEMRQLVWRSGRNSYEACQHAVSDPWLNLLIEEQNLCSDLHQALGEKMQTVARSLAHQPFHSHAN